MFNLSAAATEVFQILHAYDFTVSMWDDDGMDVIEPEDARRFFVQKQNILVALLDKNEGADLQLRVGNVADVDSLENFRESMRTLASNYNLTYSFQKFDRKIVPSEFASEAALRESEIMNLAEGMYGTSRSSYWVLPKAKMIVRHKRVIEDTPGSRARNIKHVFVENDIGERYLLPTNSIVAGKALCQHVNKGGTWKDEVGTQILEAASTLNNLTHALRYLKNNSSHLSEGVTGIMETVIERRREIKTAFNRIMNEKNYDAGIAALNELPLMNSLTESDQLDEARQLLTIDGKKLPDTVIETVAQLMDKQEKTEDLVFLKFDHNKEHGVSRNVWDAFASGNLNLRKDVDEEIKGATSDAKLYSALGQIAEVASDDRLANLFAWISQSMEHRSQNPISTEDATGMKRVAVNAVRAAKIDIARIANESLGPRASNAIRELQNWFGKFTIDNIFEDYYDDDDRRSDEFDSMRDMNHPKYDDVVEEKLESILHNFDVQAFLDEYGLDFDYGNGADAYEDNTISKQAVIATLAHCLAQEVGDSELDLTAEAESVWPNIADTLTQQGYNVSEQLSELADPFVNEIEDTEEELSEDMITSLSAAGLKFDDDDIEGPELPRDQELSLADEVAAKDQSPPQGYENGETPNYTTSPWGPLSESEFDEPEFTGNEEKSPWEQGHECAKSGGSSTDCPYADHFLKMEWLDGYHSHGGFVDHRTNNLDEPIVGDDLEENLKRLRKYAGLI